MKTLLTFFILFFSVYAHSCNCFGPLDFFSTITDTLHTQNFILKCEKLSDVEHGMEVKVIKAYRNEFEQDTIMVWGDPGWLCRKYTRSFKVGDTLILNLLKIAVVEPHPITYNESVGDFELSHCGKHDLSIKDGEVVGFINQSDSSQTMDVMTLDALLINDDCPNCIPLLDAILGPNPFFNELSIRSSDLIVSLEIYDISGKLVYTDKIDSYNIFLDTSNLNLSSGTYLLRVIGSTFLVKVFKIIKA